jgi:hypothetical protein
MTIPINQLLDSIKSQSENLNAQSKVLHSLSDTIISQRKEFGNVKKDMGDLKKSFAQNLSGISEIKKYLDSMRRGTSINGTQIGPKSGAGGASPDKGFFTNLFTKMFGPSKYQQNLLNEISALKDITDLQSKDIRFIKNQYSDKTKAYDREMLATAIANKLNSLGGGGGGGSMIGGLAAGAGSLLGGALSGLGSMIGGALIGLGPIFAAAITALGGTLGKAIALIAAAITGLTNLFRGGPPTTTGPGGGGRGAPPIIVPPGGGGTGQPPQLPGPDNKQLPNDGKKPPFKPKGFGGSGQPITDVTPNGGGRLSGALKGAGWITGLLIAAEILTEASQNPDKSFTDILKDVGSSLNPFSGFKGPSGQVDEYLKRKQEKEDAVTGVTNEDDKKFRDEMINGAKKSAEKLKENEDDVDKLVAKAYKDLDSWQDKFKGMMAEGLKGFLTLEDKLEDFIEQVAMEGFKKSVEPMLNDIGFNVDVPDAQGNMVSKRINLAPTFGTSLGEALSETYEQGKDLLNPAKEAMANYATTTINNVNSAPPAPMPAVNSSVYNPSPTQGGLYKFFGTPVPGRP